MSCYKISLAANLSLVHINYYVCIKLYANIHALTKLFILDMHSLTVTSDAEGKNTIKFSIFPLMSAGALQKEHFVTTCSM